MSHEKILVVEDEEEIQELVAYNLAKEGYRVARATSGEAALRQVRSEVPGLIVLDLMLPGMDGLETCRSLKQDVATQDIPIIMLTAKGEEADIVSGLEMGADDYITKPFSPKVLIARIRAVLRRKVVLPVDENAAVHIHDLAIHPSATRCWSATGPCSLPQPSSVSCTSSLAGRDGFSRATRLPTWSMAVTTSSPTARWMCRSSACEKSWRRRASTSRQFVALGTGSRNNQPCAKGGCSGSFISRSS